MSPIQRHIYMISLCEFSSKLKIAKNVSLGLDLVCIYYCKIHLWISLDCVCLWLISHAAEMDRFASHRCLASFLPQITPGGLVAFSCYPHTYQHTLITLGIWFCFSIKSVRCWHSRMSDVSCITQESSVTACRILTLQMCSAGIITVRVESEEINIVFYAKVLKRFSIQILQHIQIWKNTQRTSWCCQILLHC